VIGPLLGLALYAALGRRLRPLFFIAFLPAVLSVALIKLVDEPPRAPDNRPPATKDPLPAGYWRVVGFLTLFGLANFSDALVILRVHALGLGVSGVQLGHVLYNVSYAGLSYPAGAVSDRVPRHLVFAGGMGVFAAAYTCLGVVTTPSWVWLLLPLYAGFAALTDGVGKAWVADLLPERAVGRGLGYYQAITGGAACSPADGPGWRGAAADACPWCCPGRWPPSWQRRWSWAAGCWCHWGRRSRRRPRSTRSPHSTLLGPPAVSLWRSRSVRGHHCRPVDDRRP